MDGLNRASGKASGSGAAVAVATRTWGCRRPGGRVGPTRRCSTRGIAVGTRVRDVGQGCGGRKQAAAAATPRGSIHSSTQQRVAGRLWCERILSAALRGAEPAADVLLRR